MAGRKIAVAAAAAVLAGPERERIVERFIDYARNFRSYQRRSGRELRVFELTRR